MRRGVSKAKSLKRGERTRSGPAKAKTRAGRKDASSATLADKLAAKTRELDEALRQQAATSEVLKVISSSPGELQPVFKTILEQATHVCEAKFGTLLFYEGNTGFRVARDTRCSTGIAEARKQDPSVDLPDPIGDLDCSLCPGRWFITGPSQGVDTRRQA